MIQITYGLRWATGLAAGLVAATVGGHAALTGPHEDARHSGGPPPVTAVQETRSQ